MDRKPGLRAWTGALSLATGGKTSNLENKSVHPYLLPFKTDSYVLLFCLELNRSTCARMVFHLTGTSHQSDFPTGLVLLERPMWFRYYPVMLVYYGHNIMEEN